MAQMHLKIHYTGKIIMAAQEIRTTHVKVPNVDLEIAVYLAAPAGEGLTQRCGVAGNFWSQRPHREVTERIAKEGYVAIAPALFQRFAPVLKPATPEDIEIGKITSNKPRHQSYLGDIQATIDYLKNNSETRCGIGFAGGHVVLLPPADINYGFVLRCWHCHRDAWRRFFPHYAHQKSTAPSTPSLAWKTPASHLSR